MLSVDSVSNIETENFSVPVIFGGRRNPLRLSMESMLVVEIIWHCCGGMPEDWEYTVTLLLEFIVQLGEERILWPL